MLSNVHYKYNQSIEVPSPFCRGLDKREAFLYCSNKGFRGNHRKTLMTVSGKNQGSKRRIAWSAKKKRILSPVRARIIPVPEKGCAAIASAITLKAASFPAAAFPRRRNLPMTAPLSILPVLSGKERFNSFLPPSFSHLCP